MCADVKTAFGVERERLEQLLSSAPKAKEELVAALWLLGWAFDELSRVNVMLRGFSFKLSQQGTLLTLRVVIADNPVVAFVSGVHPLDCVRIAYRLWSSDGLRWSPDRFA
jgi:hypothetical protein